MLREMIKQALVLAALAATVWCIIVLGSIAFSLKASALVSLSLVGVVS